MPHRKVCIFVVATALLMLTSCSGFRLQTKDEQIIRHRQIELRQKKEAWHESQHQRNVAIADARTRGFGQSTQVVNWDRHNATADSAIEAIEQELTLLGQGVVTEEARESWRRR